MEIELSTGETVACDGAGTGAAATVLSHAHGDHLVGGSVDRVVASAATAELAGVRGEGDAPSTVEHPRVDLVPAGHVAGSRAATITDPATGRTYLYTGDISTRSRFYLDGFDPPDAEVLIIETTYGRPDYAFPPQDRLESDIISWLRQSAAAPVILFGYPLGRAQKLQRLAAAAERSRIFVTEAIAAINGVVERHLPVEFGAATFDESTELRAGDALILPASTAGRPFVEELIDGTGASTAGFSGWAVTSTFQHRGGYDVAFPLSDHCDHSELVDVVAAVDPEVVYTHHGFAEAFATHLTRHHGYRATAMQRNQATLSDF